MLRAVYGRRQSMLRLGRRWASQPSKGGQQVDEETVRRLAEENRRAEQMWNTLVPERQIDKRGVGLLIVAIIALHTYNRYNMQREAEVDSLPEGAKEQLPNGSYLMKDGSIQQIDHTPTKMTVVETPKESTLMLDKMISWARKD